MKRYPPVLRFAMVLLAFVLACGSNPATTEVDTPSVAPPLGLEHPDEIVAGRGFIVLADRRVFTVMAFLNAVGYDEEAKGKQMHPTRAEVRRLINERKAAYPREFDSWREYYQKKNLKIFHYQDFALSLSYDYPFRRTYPDEKMGYPWTASRLKDFPDTLNGFWSKVNLGEIWNEVKSEYIAEIRKYDFGRMDSQRSFLWEYLKMERSDGYVLVLIPNLLDRHYHAIWAQYENYGYSVESPGTMSYGLNIHEYLHSIVNPIVEAHYDSHGEKLREYYGAAKDQPLVASYRNPVVFTYECLVRALDWRLRVKMGDLSEQQAASRMEYLGAEGLTLAHPFYILLTEYEQEEVSFEAFVPALFERLPNYEGQI